MAPWIVEAGLCIGHGDCDGMQKLKGKKESQAYDDLPRLVHLVWVLMIRQHLRAVTMGIRDTLPLCAMWTSMWCVTVVAREATCSGLPRVS